jgi:hypothetical protein
MTYPYNLRVLDTFIGVCYQPLDGGRIIKYSLRNYGGQLLITWWKIEPWILAS